MTIDDIRKWGPLIAVVGLVVLFVWRLVAYGEWLLLPWVAVLGVIAVVMTLRKLRDKETDD